MTTGTDTDEGLVRAMAQGDTGALARAFDRYAATLTRYAWALVDNRSDVEEIVQDAFLTLWQRAATLELPADTVLP
ncbi:RNA polymerase sigma factor [Curtobacterium sp. MCPF17_051]|nr:sigma factor [Curtobacterium sp. MCPF17_051]